MAQLLRGYCPKSKNNSGLWCYPVLRLINSDSIIRGFATTRVYDAYGRLVSAVIPGDITRATSYAQSILSVASSFPEDGVRPFSRSRAGVVASLLSVPCRVVGQGTDTYTS